MIMTYLYEKISKKQAQFKCGKTLNCCKWLVKKYEMLLPHESHSLRMIKTAGKSQ